MEVCGFTRLGVSGWWLVFFCFVEGRGFEDRSAEGRWIGFA